MPPDGKLMNNTELRVRIRQLDAEIIRVQAHLESDELIAEHEAVQNQLESIVFPVQAHLDELIAERNAVQNQLDCIVYPVLTLPPELMSEIFLHCLPAGSITTKAAELLLTWVCHAWREIALSTPRLWNSICLFRSRYDCDTAGEILETWALRSAQCPLGLVLIDDDHSDSAPPMCRLYSAFAAYSVRLVDLKLQAEPETLLALGKLVLPLLTNLHVSMYTNTEQRIQVFADAPQLRSISLDIDTSPLAFDFPWHQVTKFEANWIAAHECLAVLSQASHLVECCFHVHGVPELQNDPPLVPSTWPPLHSLDLGHSSSSDLLPHLTLSELRVLKFRHSYDPLSLRSFLTRSACSLQRLEIVDYGSEVTPTLHALPSLLELRIEQGHNDNISYTLHSLSVDLTLLPHLRRLELCRLRHNFLAESGEMLLDALEARRRSVGSTERLQSVHILFGYEFASPNLPDSGLLKRFRSLADEGMILNFNDWKARKFSWF